MRYHKHKVTTVHIGCEPLNDSIWKERIEKLSKLFDGPMTIPQLALKAPEKKWDESMVKNILAAGDGTHFYYSVNGYEYKNVVAPGGHWYLRGYVPIPQKEISENNQFN